VVKKPRLSLVDQSDVTSLSPPATLGQTGSTLWRTIMSEYDIRDSGGQEMLKQVCEAADDVAEDLAIIKRDGRTIRTKAGLRDHPLIRHALAGRSFVIKSLHRLGLDIEPIRNIGRPTIGNRWQQQEE
jgi:hypothetical protein